MDWRPLGFRPRFDASRPPDGFPVEPSGGVPDLLLLLHPYRKKKARGSIFDSNSRKVGREGTVAPSPSPRLEMPSPDRREGLAQFHVLNLPELSRHPTFPTEAVDSIVWGEEWGREG